MAEKKKRPAAGVCAANALDVLSNDRRRVRGRGGRGKRSSGCSDQVSLLRRCRPLPKAGRPPRRPKIAEEWNNHLLHGVTQVSLCVRRCARGDAALPGANPGVKPTTTIRVAGEAPDKAAHTPRPTAPPRQITAQVAIQMRPNTQAHTSMWTSDQDSNSNSNGLQSINLRPKKKIYRIDIISLPNRPRTGVLRHYLVDRTLGVPRYGQLGDPQV